MSQEQNEQNQAPPAPREIARLDRNLGIKSYRSAGMGRDGEMFTCQLTLDGQAIAGVSQEGHGGDNFYDFRDRQLESELRAWAAEVTGSEYGGLDLIVEHLTGLVDLNKQARKWAKQGNEAALMILAEPQYLDEGEEPSPYSTIFRKSVFIPLRKREDAAAAAAEEGALFYALSDPLPKGAVANPEAAEKEELLKQARKWNAKDPMIRAAILIKQTITSQGTMYAVRNEEDVQRLIKKHGAALYTLSEFLPEPTREQLRRVEIDRLNKQLAEWRKRNRLIVAAVLIETDQGKRILGVPSREPKIIREHMKRAQATSEDYLISDPLPEAATGRERAKTRRGSRKK